MKTEVKNIFGELPFSTGEVFEDLIKNDKFKLEKIISRGQASPPGEWYDQQHDEWVILLSGSAGLYFEDEKSPVELKPGDYLFIPAHRRHRVEWTDPETESIWLTLHF
ncbi:cupin domain-containing protein [Bacteroidota bacterium]